MKADAGTSCSTEPFAVWRMVEALCLVVGVLPSLTYGQGVICVSESFSHKHVHQTRLAFPDLVDRDSSGAACILLCVSESTERAVNICRC